jgi:Homing endonuclease associated repeat
MDDQHALPRPGPRRVRAFHAEHGRLPRWREWKGATASRPCAKTIELRWGWRELLAEAIGVRPNQVDISWDAILDDRAEAMLAALRAARDQLGRWPTAAEWAGGGRRPSARTFARHFGSWAGGVSGGG